MKPIILLGRSVEDALEPIGLVQSASQPWHMRRSGSPATALTTVRGPPGLRHVFWRNTFHVLAVSSSVGLQECRGRPGLSPLFDDYFCWAVPSSRGRVGVERWIVESQSDGVSDKFLPDTSSRHRTHRFAGCTMYITVAHAISPSPAHQQRAYARQWRTVLHDALRSHAQWLH